jgi:diguanylate cyclase (GGDEF)-like protein
MHELFRPLRPLRLTSLVVATAVGAGAVVVLAARDAEGSWLGGRPLAALLFAALVVLAECRSLPWLGAGDSGDTSGSWIFAFALLYLTPTVTALVVMAVASVLSDVLAHKPANRSVFNAGQLVLSLAAAATAMALVADPLELARTGDVSARWLVAMAAGVVVAFVVNNVVSATAVALHQGLAVPAVVRGSFGVSLARDGMLIGLAPLCALVAVHGLALLPVLLLTVWAIDASARLALQSRHDARHDTLTGLPNRRLLIESARMALAAANAEERVAVVHVDLDRFKTINDRLGHHYGDLVLAGIARRLSASRRATDMVARVGGDEFVVLVRRVRDEAGAAAVAERILDQVRQQVVIDGIPLSVGASIGVALARDHGDDLDTLLRRADQAMYAAKTVGGDGVHFYHRDTTEDALTVPALLAELNAGLAADELFVTYQPVVALAGASVDNVTATLHWRHPRLGVLAATQFADGADGTDLGPAVIERFLQLALADCARWLEAGHEVGLSLRLPPGALTELSLPTRVERALRDRALDAGWLRLAVTEEALRADPPLTAAILGRLRALGVHIDLEDFGAGYSSLVELRRLPIERLRLAAPFLYDLDLRGADVHATRALVELGRNLGWQTVAADVSQLGVVQVLRDVGVDLVAGPLLSGELAIDDVLHWLDAWPSRASMLDVPAPPTPAQTASATGAVGETSPV